MVWSERFETFVLPELAAARSDVYSQFGEDGLIEATLARVGTENRWCFECGASDGVQYSNTKRLWDDGWNAVLVESDPTLFGKLRTFESASVRTVHRTVGGACGLDDLLAEAGAPRDLDLGVLDIDGQDYWVWSDMVRYAPRVMLVEFSPYYDERALPPRGGEGQAGLIPILALGAEKGYRHVATTAVNVLFVKADLL